MAKAKAGKSKVKLAGDDLCRNVCARIEGRKLILEVDLTAKGKPSGSKKNIVIGTTGGNQAVNDSDADRILKVGVNVYTPNPDADEDE
jgi:hypothetical protein